MSNKPVRRKFSKAGDYGRHAISIPFMSPWTLMNPPHSSFYPTARGYYAWLETVHGHFRATLLDAGLKMWRCRFVLPITELSRYFGVTNFRCNWWTRGFLHLSNPSVTVFKPYPITIFPGHLDTSNIVLVLWLFNWIYLYALMLIRFYGPAAAWFWYFKRSLNSKFLRPENEDIFEALPGSHDETL